MKLKFSVILALATGAAAAPARSVHVRRAAFGLQNGEDAIALNQKFASLAPDSPCTDGEFACVQDQFATCMGGKFILQPCGAGTICVALPLVNSRGTAITCDTAADRDFRIAQTGATAGSSGSSTASGQPPSASESVFTPSATSSSSAPAASTQPAGNNAGQGGSTGNTNDPQSSLTLLPSVIAKGFENDGQDQPEEGQVPSLTSSNNFINFCATAPNLPITNGQQIKTGSCNPAPMGIIAATTNMPSAKFHFPTNNAVLQANTSFTVKLAVSHLETGHFVSASQSYFAAPQQVNGAGDIKGHSHVVIEQLDSLNQTEPTDPTKFAFFKGLNSAARNGVLTADVTDGLQPGAYRIASINSAANHQPVVVAIAQHGALDDMVYFTVQ